MTKAERLQIECDRLNAEMPVGTLVRYWPVSGPYFHTHTGALTTVRAAFTVRGQAVVCWVVNVPGSVHARHVEPETTYMDEKAHHKWITKFSRP